jgi:ribosomal protein S18 acetylase RimI-like enzyme
MSIDRPILTSDTFKIQTFDDDIPTDIAEQMSVLYADTYPDAHSSQERAIDLRRHSGAAAFRGLTAEDSRLYVATVAESKTPIVAGFIEANTIPTRGTILEHLAWVTVDKRLRGLGVASILHEQFFTDAQQRIGQELALPTEAIVSVHGRNPALQMFRSWGYRDIQNTLDSKALMVKQVVLDDEIAA